MLRYSTQGTPFARAESRLCLRLRLRIHLSGVPLAKDSLGLAVAATKRGAVSEAEPPPPARRSRRGDDSDASASDGCTLVLHHSITPSRTELLHHPALYPHGDHMTVVAEVDVALKVGGELAGPERVKRPAVRDHGIKLLAHRKAANMVLEPDRARAAERRSPEGVLVVELGGRGHGAASTAEALAGADSMPHPGKQRAAVTAGDVGAQPNPDPTAVRGPELKVAASEEDVGERAAGDPSFPSRHGVELIVVQEDSVCHDRPAGHQQPRTVKDGGVTAPRVQRFHKRHLVRALGDVALHPTALFAVLGCQRPKALEQPFRAGGDEPGHHSCRDGGGTGPSARGVSAGPQKARRQK